jgi:hypothetical protein
MASEIWRTVEEFPEYEVSNLGRVKSLNYNGTKQAVVLKPVKQKKGYLKIGLYKNKKYYSRQIHRLVATAFIDNPDKLPQVNHIDGDKNNNSVYNLEWCNNRYNQLHAINNGLRHTKKVAQYSKNGILIKVWARATEASKALNIDVGHIGQVCKGLRATAGGYIWKYEGANV